MFLKKIRSRLAAMELKNTQLEIKVKSMGESIEEIVKNINNDAPTLREIEFETGLSFLRLELEGEDKRISALEEKLKKMEEAPPAEELTKEQIEAMERQLYEWQNGAEDER